MTVIEPVFEICDIMVWIRIPGSHGSLDPMDPLDYRYGTLHIRIWILLFYSVAFRMTKYKFFSKFCFFLGTVTFGTDPDTQIRESVPLTNGSGSKFFAYNFLKLHLHNFSMIKSHTEITKQ